MWCHDAEQLREISEAGENVKFLPGHKINQKVHFEADDKIIFASYGRLGGADVVRHPRKVALRTEKRTCPANARRP